ncbi:hypothetical protein GTO91_04140 [Heliobacterium undosum]|uniref:Uncharacterized protein n=1 Tax=Heliomicrobium undosum TaxID=121734 RepID=A0A845L1M0_9FIRM|nr:hypothetical protein [Heliomicrobium undosum]MZP28899.1 hypothetical protein [Heliomicrobium undosum]
MAGKIKMMIDQVISAKGKGNPILMKSAMLKFKLNGIDPDRYSLSSPDEHTVIEKVKKIAHSLGVAI